jgi:hypothetical protein
VILTNANVWSPDSKWIVFDRRSDAAGSRFDSTTIERMFVATGETEVLYRSGHGAHVGVATVNPVDGRVVFIHGPEHPTDDWQYSACHRQGMIAELSQPGRAIPLDARDLVPPFTRGALRGGSHVHTWDSRGEWVSFTYEDHLQPHRRTVGLAIPGRVSVPKTHPRNHDGSHASVVSVATVGEPEPGSEEIGRAFEDAWIPGTRSITFIGELRAADGRRVNELFRLDYPERFDRPDPGPAGMMPAPPREFQPIRLTRWTGGLTTSPRHWPRASGGRVACLVGTGQLILVSFDGRIVETGVTVDSAFTWHPDGEHLIAVVGGRPSRIHVDSRRVVPLSEERARPEACVVSPDGTMVAYVAESSEGNRIRFAKVGKS